jgi:outer membrane receptor for ferric coprogen and ferric-rhodotorulic acid
MYVVEFAASWKGNWTGSFTASVSLYQYESADQATADENPSNPAFPYSVSTCSIIAAACKTLDLEIEQYSHRNLY